MNSFKKSIIKTLAYADVFDYPLTLEEIWKYLISEDIVTKEKLKGEIAGLNSEIKKQGKFYFLQGRSKIIEKRKRREEESKEKIAKLKKIIPFLSFVPTVQFIGVSGALAMQNAERQDDIDLFVITKKNTLWVTRLILIVMLQLLGSRRKRNGENSKDKICLNFLIDETELNFSKRNDLYNAHEICQMKAVFNRNNLYQRFMNTNKWVEKFLPNCINDKMFRLNENLYKKSKLSLFELPAKRFQFWYMKKHRTREIVSDSVLAFHPIDYKTRILNAYKLRLKKYEKI